MLAILDRVKSFAKPPLVIGTAARADDVDSQIRSRFGATLRVDMPGRPARKTAWQLPMLAGVVAAALAVGLYVHANPFHQPTIRFGAVLATPPRSDPKPRDRPCVRDRPGPTRPTTAGLVARLRIDGLPVRAWKPTAQAQYGWAAGSGAVGL